jgi:adenylate cyclase
MNGLALLQELRGRFTGHATIITAYGDYDCLRAAMNQGAFDFLNKPIDFTDLETTLARSLQVQATMNARIAHLEHKLKRTYTRIQDLEARCAPLISPRI